MLLSCAGVPLESRGLSEIGKRNSGPRSIEITMKPFRNSADFAVSVNVFMPLLDDKRLMRSCKLLGVGKLSNLQANRLSKLNDRINIEHGFTSAIGDVVVQRGQPGGEPGQDQVLGRK